MNWRHTGIALGAGLLAVALAAAQPAGAQPALPRVVWVSPNASSQGGPFFEELRRGLREVGQVEGRTLQLEAAWGDGTPQQAAKLMAAVVAGAPSIIVTQGSMGILAGKATTTIPVVFG